MPVSKPEDTQAMSTADIKAEGLRPRVRNTNNPQTSTVVQVAALLTVLLAFLAAVGAIVVITLANLGKL